MRGKARKINAKAWQTSLHESADGVLDEGDPNFHDVSDEDDNEEDATSATTTTTTAESSKYLTSVLRSHHTVYVVRGKYKSSMGGAVSDYVTTARCRVGQQQQQQQQQQQECGHVCTAYEPDSYDGLDGVDYGMQRCRRCRHATVWKLYVLDDDDDDDDGDDGDDSPSLPKVGKDVGWCHRCHLCSQCICSDFYARVVLRRLLHRHLVAIILKLCD